MYDLTQGGFFLFLDGVIARVCVLLLGCMGPCDILVGAQQRYISSHAKYRVTRQSNASILVKAHRGC